MVNEIVWTKTAERKFDEMVDYLAEQGAENEIRNLISKLKNRLTILSKYPEMGRLSTNTKTVRYQIYPISLPFL